MWAAAISAAVLAVQGALWRIYGSENQNAGVVMAAVLAPIASFVVVRNAFRRVDQPLCEVPVAVDRVRRDSRHRYEVWLKALSSDEPERYDVIIDWQQRQDHLIAQQRQVYLAEQQMRQAQAHQQDMELLGAYLILRDLGKTNRR